MISSILFGGTSFIPWLVLTPTTPGTVGEMGIYTVKVKPSLYRNKECR